MADRAPVSSGLPASRAGASNRAPGRVVGFVASCLDITHATGRTTMPRELWKGAIVFGLVNVPVGLYPAEHGDELDLTMLDKRDLEPVGYKRYNKSTGAEVPYDKIVKGYEYEKGRYVTLEKEDFARANVEATQEIDIVGFVEASDVAPYYFQAPYYTAPAKHGEKGYALLRETLQRTGKAAVANVVIRTRQHLALLYPRGKVLVLNTLRYCDELRPMKDIEASAATKGAKVHPNEMKMAERLVAEMTVKWEPAQYHDTYHDDLMKLIEEKAKGHLKAAPAHKAPRKAEVIDFAKLLEKSLASRKRGSSKQADGKGAESDAKPHARAKRAAPRTRRKAGTRSTTQHRRAA
jgi:DNA end-binding protein Ku